MVEYRIGVLRWYHRTNRFATRLRRSDTYVGGAAGRVLCHPQAKIATAIFNGLLGFVMLVTFCIGNFDDVLNSTVGVFGYPFVEVFAEGT
jgi:hypothetical protein